VHERYYGRRLRCTACRAEFVADPEQPGLARGDAKLPPFTIHTCTACGIEMQVNERYYGRSLRCTSCGEEFVARLPVLKRDAPRDSAEKTGQVAEKPSGRRPVPWRAIAVTTLVVGLVVVALWWLGGEREGGFGSSLFRATKGRTQLGVLRYGDQPVVLAALDRETARRLARAVEDRDDRTLRELRDSPNCLLVAAGCRVRVLERHKRRPEARVRILDGPQNSRIVWVPITWVH
jgi:predicted RNA-binding Zn-ribbon protein involved in translation (DUF1610 family)